jgi:hypothetical protein
MDDYVLPVTSSLDSLARRTSSRRRPNPAQTPLSQAGLGESAQYTHDPVLGAPPRRPLGPAPHSPLLHTRFRTSVATQSSRNTSTEFYGPPIAIGSEDFPYDDDVSIYSTGASSGPTPGRLSDSVRAPARAFLHMIGREVFSFTHWHSSDPLFILSSPHPCRGMAFLLYLQ